MEFHEKLQALRKQKGLTQEELAEILHVSRAAVSKWESGRGYPNIDSLKQIAGFFHVTIDDLLSGEEVLNIAEENHKQKQIRFRRLVFGLLDLSAALFLFLPLFGKASNGSIQAVPLLLLTGIPSYLQIFYYGIILGLILWGILTLVLQNLPNCSWSGRSTNVSFALNISATLLFIISKQPYAASLLFVFLIIKVFICFRRD